jgi:hypothetical protein
MTSDSRNDRLEQAMMRIAIHRTDINLISTECQIVGEKYREDDRWHIF